MIDFETAARLVRLQERLRRSTYMLMKEGEVHKSGEAAVTLSFHLPPVVGDDDKPHWSVNVWSYLLCPDARQATWIAASPVEAIAKAEDAVAQWCMETEMNEFATMMGVLEDDPDLERPSEPRKPVDSDPPKAFEAHSAWVRQQQGLIEPAKAPNQPSAEAFQWAEARSREAYPDKPDQADG